VVRELKVKLGDTVNIGDLLAVVLAAAPAAAAPVAPRRRLLPLPRRLRRQRIGGGGGSGLGAGSSRQPLLCRRITRSSRRAPACRMRRPSVRKHRAAELGVPLEEVRGTGPKGRITEARPAGIHALGDVRCRADPAPQAAARRPRRPRPRRPATVARLGLLPWPKVDFAKFGPVERQDLPAHQEDQWRPTCTATGILIPARHEP
jgi:pyruvate dehydrogenase E2 component (dihydrolipoamide acetyltransferase)